MPTTHYWFVQWNLLPLIIDGSKDLEARFGYPWIRRVAVEDIIIFNHNAKAVRKVVAIRPYKNFDQVLGVEDHERIYPGLKDYKRAPIMRRLRQDPNQPLGVFVFELQPVVLAAHGASS